MTTAPVLALPDFSLPFTLQVDASGTSIGVVLMQKGHPAYVGKSLGLNATAQSTYENRPLQFWKGLKFMFSQR